MRQAKKIVDQFKVYLLLWIVEFLMTKFICTIKNEYAVCCLAQYIQISYENHFNTSFFLPIKINPAIFHLKYKLTLKIFIQLWIKSHCRSC
jgi:hypothetical protein